MLYDMLRGGRACIYIYMINTWAVIICEMYPASNCLTALSIPLTFFTSFPSSVCRKSLDDTFVRKIYLAERWAWRGNTRLTYMYGGGFSWPETSGIIPTDDASRYLIGISVNGPLHFLLSPSRAVIFACKQSCNLPVLNRSLYSFLNNM